MITIKQAIKLSAIIDKVGLKINNPEATQEEVGSDLMMQVVSKAHKAEKEIYSLISSVKKIDVKEAEEVDVIEFAKEMLGDIDIMGFFKSAVKQELKE